MERFWKKVDKTDSCWNWTAGKTRGYGSFRIGHRMHYAHRVVLGLMGIDVPEDMEVCHHCDNKKCVNPDHLFISNHHGNMSDMRLKGRSARGSRNGMSTLCELDVWLIRQLCETQTQQVVADWFGISSKTVSKIMLGQRWAHVE